MSFHDWVLANQQDPANNDVFQKAIAADPAWPKDAPDWRQCVSYMFERAQACGIAQHFDMVMVRDAMAHLWEQYMADTTPKTLH